MGAIPIDHGQFLRAGIESGARARLYFQLQDRASTRDIDEYLRFAVHPAKRRACLRPLNRKPTSSQMDSSIGPHDVALLDLAKSLRRHRINALARIEPQHVAAA